MGGGVGEQEVLPCLYYCPINACQSIILQQRLKGGKCGVVSKVLCNSSFKKKKTKENKRKQNKQNKQIK
jgi:hypothetical protein